MISILILAAGMSSRMGQAKQLLALHGRSMLQHVIQTAGAGGLDEIVIVLGHKADEISRTLELPSRARIVINPEFAQGQSTSLRAGLRAVDAESEAAVILLGDQPGLPVAAVGKIVEVFRATAAPAVRTTWDGKPGHPVLIARSQFESMERATGDEGAKKILDRLPDLHEVEMGMAPVKDLDTWEEYEAARRASQNNR